MERKGIEEETTNDEKSKAGRLGGGKVVMGKKVWGRGKGQQRKTRTVVLSGIFLTFI